MILKTAQLPISESVENTCLPVAFTSTQTQSLGLPGASALWWAHLPELFLLLLPQGCFIQKTF